MVFTVFPRQALHTTPLFFTGPKVASALGHLMIGPIIYLLLNQDAPITEKIFRWDNQQPVTGDRLTYFVAFSTIYGLRWALGAFTTNAGNPMPWNAAIQVVILHTMLYIVPMTILSTTKGGLPSTLSEMDYFAFGLSVLAGIFQHVSELQRLIFKCDPANKGKLHTSGLFAYARYINHTGHFLQDVALAIATRSMAIGIMAMFFLPVLVYQLTPETEAHMQNKYKGKYEAYVKMTPWKFIPFVW